MKWLVQIEDPTGWLGLDAAAVMAVLRELIGTGLRGIEKVEELPRITMVIETSGATIRDLNERGRRG